MEPMVIFGAGLVVYCGYIALADAGRDRRSAKVITKNEEAKKRRIRTVRRRLISSTPRRAGGGGAHWPGPLTGSV